MASRNGVFWSKEDVRMDVGGAKAAFQKHRSGGVDHCRRARKIGFPAVEIAKVGGDRVGDVARPEARARSFRQDRHEAEVGMPRCQRGEAVEQIEVTFRTHAEIDADRLAHAFGTVSYTHLDVYKRQPQP